MIVTAPQILFSLIRYVTETKFNSSGFVFFSDFEEEPDDEAVIKMFPMRLSRRSLLFFFFRVWSGGTKERCFLSVKSGYRPPCSYGPLTEE